MIARTPFLCAVTLLAMAASPAGAQRKYVGTPDDFMQISQLFSQYNYTIDNGDGEGWAHTFTADGVFRDPSWCAIGRDALISVVGRDARVGKDQDHHHVPALGPIVYQDRDTATVHSTVMVIRETGFGKTGGIMVTGTYDDRLKRVNGRWLFSYRWVHRPSATPPIACARQY
jgi:hypothetical protein